MKLQNIKYSTQCLLLDIVFQFHKEDAMQEHHLDTLREYGAASLRKIYQTKTGENQYTVQLLLGIDALVDGIDAYHDNFHVTYQCNPTITKMRIINKHFDKVKLPKSLELPKECE